MISHKFCVWLVFLGSVALAFISGLVMLSALQPSEAVWLIVLTSCIMGVMLCASNADARYPKGSAGNDVFSLYMRCAMAVLLTVLAFELFAVYDLVAPETPPMLYLLFCLPIWTNFGTSNVRIWEKPTEQ